MACASVRNRQTVSPRTSGVQPGSSGPISWAGPHPPITTGGMRRARVSVRPSRSSPSQQQHGRNQLYSTAQQQQGVRRDPAAQKPWHLAAIIMRGRRPAPSARLGFVGATSEDRPRDRRPAHEPSCAAPRVLRQTAWRARGRLAPALFLRARLFRPGTGSFLRGVKIWISCRVDRPSRRG